MYNKNINNLEELQEAQDELIENNKKFLNERTMELFKTIDMFYDVYKLKKSNLNYIQKGIKYIKAVLNPEFTIKIPLEIVQISTIKSYPEINSRIFSPK